MVRAPIPHPSSRASGGGGGGATIPPLIRRGRKGFFDCATSILDSQGEFCFFFFGMRSKCWAKTRNVASQIMFFSLLGVPHVAAFHFLFFIACVALLADKGTHFGFFLCFFAGLSFCC